MKFDTANAMRLELRVGNVYPAQGKQSGTYWVVVAIIDNSVALLRVDAVGNIVGAQTYGKHVFDGSNKHFNRNAHLLGVVKNIENIVFQIDWVLGKESQ